MPSIKHIVLSGGGPTGLIGWGAIVELVKKEYIIINDIESLYATSAG